MRALIVVCLMALGAPCFGAIMGIDFGSEFIKVAAPKNNNIDIVLNEQSHRKTHNFIGFRGSERYFAEDAKNLAPRFPDNMFTFMNQLVGTPFNDTTKIAWVRDQLHLKLNLVEAPKPSVEEETNATLGTVAFKTGSNPTATYASETLLGMMFGYIRTLVKKDTGTKLRDAVVTIPANFTSRQRQAIIDSAALAGVNVLATLHSTTAFALQYGLKNRGFGNHTHTLVIFDMGAAHTDVGIYEFTPSDAPKKGKKLRNAEALGTLTAKAIVSDAALGGRSFDVCLAEMIEDRFVHATKLARVLSAETLQKRKSTIALLRAGNKAKETLSANKQANVVAEGMAPNKDFPTTISREEFEAQCSSLFDRAVELVRRAAKQANVDLTSVDAFELAGAASRVPKLIESLSTLRGRAVDRTLNTDEAAAIGAAYFGGVLAGRFSVKSFAVKEPLFLTPRSIVFALSPRNDTETATFRTLFPSDSRLGQLKSVTVNRTSSFNITLAFNDSSLVTNDAVVRVSGIEQGLRSVGYYDSSLDLSELGLPPTLKHPNNTHSIRVEFKAAESGFVVIEGAELRVTYAQNVTQRVKVNLTEDELDAERATVRNSTLSKFEAAEARAAAANVTGNTTQVEDVNGTDAERNRTAKIDAAVEKALSKIKTFKMVPTTVEEMQRTVLKLKVKSSFAFPSPLTRGDKKLLRQILEDFDFTDEQKRALAKAKNDLEGYLIWTKSDGVLENPEVRANAHFNEHEETIAGMVKQVSTWLDEEANDETPREAYEERLRGLKKVVEPVLAKAATDTNGTVSDTEQASAAETSGDGDDATTTEASPDDDSAGETSTSAGGEAEISAEL